MSIISHAPTTQPTYVIIQEQKLPVFNRIAGTVGTGIGSASAVHAYNITMSIVNEIKLEKMAIAAGRYSRPIMEVIVDAHKYNLALIIGGIALSALCFKVAHNY